METILVVLLATFFGANAFKAGDCSNSKAIESLDLKSLEGKWYEFSSFGTPLSHRLERCFESTIKAGSDGKSFIMANDRIIKLLNTHIRTNWTVATNDQLTGDLTLKFKLPFIGSLAVPFKIVGTDDYNNYIILHACYSVASIFKSNLGFIFTRKRRYEAKELESLYSSIDETLKNNGLSRSQFTLSNQYNCEDKSASPSNTGSADNNTPSSSSTNDKVEENKTSETATETSPSTNEEVQENKTPETATETSPSTNEGVQENKIPETAAETSSSTNDEVQENKTPETATETSPSTNEGVQENKTPETAAETSPSTNEEVQENKTPETAAETSPSTNEEVQENKTSETASETAAGQPAETNTSSTVGSDPTAA